MGKDRMKQCYLYWGFQRKCHVEAIKENLTVVLGEVLESNHVYTEVQN